MGRRNDAKLMGPNATAAFIPPWHSPWSVPVRGQHRLSREALKGGGGVTRGHRLCRDGLGWAGLARAVLCCALGLSLTGLGIHNTVTTFGAEGRPSPVKKMFECQAKFVERCFPEQTLLRPLYRPPLIKLMVSVELPVEILWIVSKSPPK